MNDLLERMMDADPKLYERILDTPGFAKAFNDLCQLARTAEDAVAAERERCAKLVEGFATDQPRVGVTFWGEALAGAIRSGN